MPPSPVGPRSDRAILFSILRGNLLVAIVLFGLGVLLFLRATLPMSNDFATFVRTRAPGIAVAANLRTLPGYLLLAIGYTLLAFPALRKRRAFRERRRLAGFAQLLAVDLAVFALSLGTIATLVPGVVDFFARYLPDFGLYAVKEIPLLPATAAAFGVWTLFTLAVLVRSFRTKAAVATASGLAALAFAVAPGRPVPLAPDLRVGAGEIDHVLVIASDALRADHLSCYGYGRQTSPTIDRLAEEGVLFENMTVSTASTLESWTTMLSSKEPRSHGLRYMFPSKERVAKASADPELLPRLLGRSGFRSAVSSNWVGNCFRVVDHGFDANLASDVQNLDTFVAEAALMAHFVFPLYFDNRLGELIYPAIRQITTYLDPDALVDRIEGEFVATAAAKRRFFGVLFASTTHLPFVTSWPYNVKFVDPAYRGPNRYVVEFDVDRFIQDGFQDALAKDEAQHLIDLYDGAVAQFDDTVKEVLRRLEEHGLLDRTLIVIAADHGEDLYDPGTTLGHGTNFFGGDQTTRIPFVLRWPDRRHAGTRVPAIVRSVDVAPTLLDALSFPTPPGFEGRSLLPLVRDPDLDSGRPAFAETCYLFFPKRGHPEGALTVSPADRTLYVDAEFRNNLVLKEEYHEPVIAAKDRMVRTRRWKLIEIPGRSAPIRRLHDMLLDPQQATNLAGRGLEVESRLAERLHAWWTGSGPLEWTLDDDRPR